MLVTFFLQCPCCQHVALTLELQIFLRYLAFLVLLSVWGYYTRIIVVPTHP